MSGGSLTSMEKVNNARDSNSNNSRKRENSNRNNSGSSSSSTSQQQTSSRERNSNVSVAPNAADMLNSLFTSATKGSSGLTNVTAANLLHSNLSSYFSSPPSSTSNTSTKMNNNSSSGGGITSAMDYSSLFSHMTPSKLQEMSSLFSSQSRYLGIPDPLAKTTLAANNAYLSPSLMKLQQEALNTRLMKPPKSSSSSSSSKVETPPPTVGVVLSPTSDKRSTPTKSLRDSPAAVASTMPKYNFSAADLAISSHVLSASSTPTDFSRKSTPTPPVDLAMKDRSVPPKKRMEFSSIAELVAPSPSKRQKYSDDDEIDDEPAVLNLSNN
ncbi:CLUMA_CG014490, isoform A [Clunio marinus]|uniref:CLUMA_CG014490, isoform A n=1 Tax=Clunio marinus TaxID=568069 RepID=A0A1J1IN96_9DIPT|nr:CLUMA_CG014490, isoform A [Clunio marinus]